MGILATSIAPAASGVMPTNQSSTHARATDSGSVQTAIANSAVATTAAVVNLSKSGKSRRTSNSPNRQVDGTFEKQAAKGKSDKEGGAPEKEKVNSVDVSA